MQIFETNICTLERLISESIYQALYESSQDKAALIYLKSRGITDYNEQMKYIGSLKNDIPNLRLDKGKFMVGALRMYFNGELSNYDNIESFNKVLNCISKHGHTDEYNFDLNGLSLRELYDKYDEEIRLDAENDRERSGQTQRGNGNGYKIIPINSFEEAKKYRKYNDWCVTYREDQFDAYTSGGKRFYFCLKDGFESVERNDDGAPLNEYGLSMLAVLVDTDGNLCQITTRYNHDYDGENNRGLRTVEQLEDVLDVNFYRAFKPYTHEELHEMGIIPFDEVQELLDSGKKPSEVFDYFGDFHEGFAVVRLNDKYNYIDTNNKLLSNKWFDDCQGFNEGFGGVGLGGKFNFIDKNCELLSPNQWFDYCDFFSGGFARVQLGEKWNYIDTNGEIISQNQWFYDCDDFSGGFARVQLGEKWNYIDTNGEILSPNQWFDWCGSFSEGFCKVRLGEKCNYLNTNGELLSKNQWFDVCSYFYEGFACVQLGEEWNFINKNGELLSPDQWFDGCSVFCNGVARVKLNNKYNYINTNGEIVFDQWFDECIRYPEGFSVVKLGRKYNYINTNGKIVFDQWFDNCYDFSEGFARVQLGKKWNYIDRNGKLLSPSQWFDFCYAFRDGFAIVLLNDKWLKINTNGEILN